MAIDKLRPTDNRVQHKHTTLNGRAYHYLLSLPQDGSVPKGTILLIHGWPDLAFGWRYQIPFLTKLGLRVVAPDMQGYGLSGSPQDLADYTLKAACDDLAALAKELECPQVFVLGHDWGGAVAWRFALWYPQLITAVATVCTPYWGAAKDYHPLEVVTKTVLPNFRYQVQLAGPDVEREIVGKEKLGQFLTALYNGRTTDGELGFTTEQGVIFENLPRLKPIEVMNPEELAYYVEQYDRNGMRGPLNWYRTRKLNFEEEKVLADKENLKVQAPSLFVLAKRDAALPEKMSYGMERNFVDLTRGEVETGHWALWEKPEEVNKIVGDFLEKHIASSESSKL